MSEKMGEILDDLEDDLRAATDRCIRIGGWSECFRLGIWRSMAGALRNIGFSGQQLEHIMKHDGVAEANG